MRHVAVEFVHPVIVGKRALPAIGLVPATRARSRAQVDLLAEADDIVIAFGARPRRSRPRSGAARARGCLTVAVSPRSAPSGS